MIQFTNADIQALRLIGWCKDVPPRPEAPLTQERLGMFELLGLSRKSKSGRSIRLTQKGYRLLADCGYELPQDKYPVGAGRVLERRLQTAGGMRLFYLAGVDVFLQNTDQFSGSNPQFLPSFALRQRQSVTENMLGATRFLGFLKCGSNMYIPYFLQTGKEQFIPETELAVAKAVSSLCGEVESLRLLLICERPEEIARLAAKPFKWQKIMPVANALGVPYPVYLLPRAAEEGARQLRLILAENYLGAILRLSEAAVTTENCPPEFDAILRDNGSPFLVGVDGDIKRMLRAHEVARREETLLHILCFGFQIPFLEPLVRGARFLELRETEINRVMGLSDALYQPDNTAFITPGGFLIGDDYFAKEDRI